MNLLNSECPTRRRFRKLFSYTASIFFSIDITMVSRICAHYVVPHRRSVIFFISVYTSNNIVIREETYVV